jgi:RNA polymerase sigma-70 factor (ECF subfamily)
MHREPTACSMSPVSQSDSLLVQRIRGGDEEAWRELIARFEGRLLAFVEGRIGRRSAGEDVVQETFLGFLNSLPNYDPQRPLESYLFSIAAHKLTDHLRREGRRPALPLTASGSHEEDRDLPARGRPVSSILRSGERRSLEEAAVAAALVEQIERLQSKQEWDKLACLELLLVRGLANKDVAAKLGLTEQHVANFKFDFLARLRSLVRNQNLSEDVFPELKETNA